MQGKLHRKVQYAFAFPAAGNAMNGGIRCIIRPTPLSDDIVRGVIPGTEHKGGYDSSILKNHIAVPFADIVAKHCFSRIIICPLGRIACFSHKSSGKGKDFHQPREVFRSRFAYCHFWIHDCRPCICAAKLAMFSAYSDSQTYVRTRAV